MLLCGVYYVIWIYVLPRYGGYQMRSEILVVEDTGATAHRLVKVKNEDLEEWDSTHDEAGNQLQQDTFYAEVKN